MGGEGVAVRGGGARAYAPENGRASVGGRSATVASFLGSDTRDKLHRGKLHKGDFTSDFTGAGFRGGKLQR